MNSDASRSSTKKPSSPAAIQLRSRSAAIVSWKRSPRRVASMKSKLGSSRSLTSAIASADYPRAGVADRRDLRDGQGGGRRRLADRRLSRVDPGGPRQRDRAPRARPQPDPDARDRDGLRAL